MKMKLKNLKLNFRRRTRFCSGTTKNGDEVEEDQSSIPSKKHKTDKDGASITSTIIDTAYKEDKSRQNMVKETNTSPISAKIILTHLKKREITTSK